MHGPLPRRGRPARHPVSGPTPLAIAADMAARFERHGVRYVLGGSMASAVFGEPRSTLDIDFAADLSALTIEPWLADVRTEFGLDEAWARTEVARRGSFQMMHRRELVRIDVFVPPWTGIHEWKWRTRRLIQPLTSSGGRKSKLRSRTARNPSRHPAATAPPRPAGRVSPFGPRSCHVRALRAHRSPAPNSPRSRLLCRKFLSPLAQVPQFKAS